MAFKRLSMRKIHLVLRLFFEAGLSIRAISRSIGASPSTVGEYVRRAAAAGLSWPLPEGVDERSLEARLFPGSAAAVPTETCTARLVPRARGAAAQGRDPLAAVAGVQGRAPRRAPVQLVL